MALASTLGFGPTQGFDSKVPLDPTQIAARFDDGRVLGIDNSVWLIRKVPLRPYADARSLVEQLMAAEPIMQAWQELSGLAYSIGTPRRFTSKGTYREVQHLLVNVPTLFEPDPASPLAIKHRRDYGNHVVDERVLLFAVKLRPSVTKSGLAAAVDSVVETFAYGGTPMSDFDHDAKEIGSLLSRAGMTMPSSTEIRLADSWWSEKRRSDSHFAQHPDHLHVFASAASTLKAREQAERPCSEWPDIEGHNVISIASIADFDLKFVESRKEFTQWASDAVRQGALAISIRGLIEPAKVSAEEMRRQYSRVKGDIEERYKNNKLSKKQQEDLLDLLRDVSRAYEGGGMPTLTGASILIAFNGMRDETKLMRYSCATPRLMENRQYPGLLEMQLASSVRANPNRQELPSSVVAGSGIVSLNRVGDRSGALLGFDERDDQPSFFDPSAASTADGLPIAVILGATGSGKSACVNTQVRTPFGTVRLGDLKVGDQVLGRDGRPCNVLSIHEQPTPEKAYRLTLSDGQTIKADSNHQWVVSSRTDRTSMRRPKHMLALQRAEESRALAGRLHAKAMEIPVDTWMTYHELSEVLSTIPGVRFMDRPAIIAALDMMDTPRKLAKRAIESPFSMDEMVKSDPVNVWPARESVQRLHEMWTKSSSSSRWAEGSAIRAKASLAVLESLGGDERWTVRQIAEAIDGVDPAAGVSVGVGRITSLNGSLRRFGLTPTKEFREVTVPVAKARRLAEKSMHIVPARRALVDIANRTLQQITVDDAPYIERVMSTGEILAEGVITSTGHANWSIHLAEPLDLPEADLPVAPYTLGAWLGDGSTASDGLTGIDPEIWAEIVADGYEMWHHPTIRKHHRIVGLTGRLREAGFSVRSGQDDKHIPVAYLRASYEQRLAVLQGLMDTDGTISKAGSCELSLSHERLATDALELIRSLGIKASVSVGEGSYRLRNAETGELGEKVVCKDRHRIKFTTAQPVFRLPRKRSLLPTELRETQQWLYIESIEPIEPEPMRCITVDSPDSTYLIEGFVPTHNTMVGLNLMDQFQAMGSPGVFIDPKNHTEGEGHGPVIRAMGGQVASLDDLMSSDGVFDPVRFMPTTDSAIEMGTSLLLSINPWGQDKDRHEVALAKALRHGIEVRKATCLGEALKFAYEDGILEGNEEVYTKCEDLASLPQFGALYGRDPKGKALNVNDGITLIEVGSTYLPIPEPGSQATDITQRIAMALIRMMVFGSANALTGRNGVVALDEAWVFLSAGREEMNRLGRLARSQRVLPILMTQRVTDALDAGLEGYISRGIILHISDAAEARAACQLFGVEPTEARIGRIRASHKLGGEDYLDDSVSAGHNTNSLKALVEEIPDPDFPGLMRRVVVRGSVGFYADLNQRFIPVTMTLPEEFLLLASTNPLDMARRERVLADRARERARSRRRASLHMQTQDEVDDLFTGGIGAGAAGEAEPELSPFEMRREQVSAFTDRSADVELDGTPAQPAPAAPAVSAPAAVHAGMDVDDLFG
ncbi:ATP-binding protein [Brachybacterium sp. JHP9]|uniref:ATP-binding protein n=1 Tax=Brachybacterium equifaecis TaxID=2910770 RepID=A0ABT0R181_9MICO|nr:ATP-binding protein [Brachybacterium equifaecis]MCL6423677.1 ATP-binding protein [Brachybacterium equifaecis]